MKTVLLVCMIYISGISLNAQTSKYIGSKMCKMCHNITSKGEQFNKWSAGPHANAMEVLSEAEASDPKCLKCHSTAGAVDASLIATITVEEGVSCESCHGPGSLYRMPNIMQDEELRLAKGFIVANEKVCKKCHNEESPHYKGFNYADYLAKIAHPNPLSAK